MGQPRAKPIDELVEHELAVEQRLVVVADFLGQAVQELGLDLAQRLGRQPAAPRQVRIGLLPLPQFDGPLLLRGRPTD